MSEHHPAPDSESMPSEEIPPQAMLRHTMSRRSFVQSTAVAAALPVLTAGWAGALRAQEPENKPEEKPADKITSEKQSDAPDHSLKGRLYKTLKINMAKGVEGSLVDKFKAIKEAGFRGVEMNSPGMDVEQTVDAIRQTGLIVDGTVCSTHWKIRHTSPDAGQRQQALADLQKALRDTNAVGGRTVLLVVGHGKDGSEAEIWKRSIENISKAIPLAAELGVSIALENVWNEFLYDHMGNTEQGADKFVKYVDEVNSPWFGVQFDIGNHWKYGSMGDWIRTLGRRIVKLDLKGFSRAEDTFKNIGEGDLDWTDVRKALLEINYYGWAAAEVGGGDLNRLKQISANMDKVFALT